MTYTEEQIAKAAAAAAEKANGGKFHDPLFYKPEHRDFWRGVVRSALEAIKNPKPEARPQFSGGGFEEIHRSMGEFLTACAHLENMMYGLFTVCESGRKSVQEIGDRYLPLTFGQRVELLEESCRESQLFNADLRKILDDEFARLRQMVKKRNLIVHGSTFEMAFEAGKPKSYRIGAPKDNPQYMEQFFRLNGEVDHSFTADQVREASIFCDSIRGQLATVSVETMAAKAATQTKEEQ